MFERLTLDHLLGQQLWRYAETAKAQAGQIGEVHDTILIRALGVEPEIPIDIQYLPAEPATLYLLCSDGVTKQVADDEIRDIVLDESRSLTERCKRLLDAADRQIGSDNATALLVRRI